MSLYGNRWTEIGARPVYVELPGGVPFTVAVERVEEDQDGETRTYLDGYDVENCGTREEPDLWYNDSGDTGGHLGGFWRRWRPGFRRQEVWWADDYEEVTCRRPFANFLAYCLLRRLRLDPGYDFDLPKTRWNLFRVRLRTWLSTTYTNGKPTRFGVWRTGYRRLKELPEIYQDLPENYASEGDTVWCNICEKRYPASSDYGWMRSLPAYVLVEDRRGEASWQPAELAYDPAKAAAAWLAAEALRDAASSWGQEKAAAPSTLPRLWRPRSARSSRNSGALPGSTGRDWQPEIADEFSAALEHLAGLYVDHDQGREPAGRHRVKIEALDRLRSSFSERVKYALGQMARKLERDAARTGTGERFGLEELDHLCPHVFWVDEVGWTGPGADS